MGNITDSKESRYAQEFLMKSKKVFDEKIARNKVNSIDVADCVLDETYAGAARFSIVGSVETTSPTGKLKTYEYKATVDVKGKDCSFVALDVLPLEE